MSQTHGPRPADSPADVVEFGGSGPERARTRSWWRRVAGLREPRTGWAVLVLGAASLFASLVGEWATTTIQYPDGSAQEWYVVGAGTVGNWGIGWMVGGFGLAVAVGMCLAGPSRHRTAARAAGLALAGALLLLMVAATIEIGDPDLAPGGPLGAMTTMTVFGNFLDLQIEVSLGRGLFAAYAALGLLAAVLWLSGGRPPAGAEATRPDPSPPDDSSNPDLTVGPAEPFVHPASDHEWR